MEAFKIAAVQMNAIKEDLEHNLDVHVRFIQKAAKQKCQLVMFPELSATAHYGDENVVQFGEESGNGRIFKVIANQACRHKILVSYGFCERAYGTYYNSQALVGPEGLIGVQRKIHASMDEYFNFRMGRSLETFDVGFCRIGTLICYDADFFEAWRVLALKGAEVILLPHASRSGWGKQINKDKQIKSMTSILKELSRCHSFYAKGNGVFAVFANQVGYNGHSTHEGGAYVLDPLGQVIIKSRMTLDDHMVTAKLKPRTLEKARRARWYQLRDRRPEVYGELSRMI